MADAISQNEDTILKLSYKEKVPVAVMKDIIHNCLTEKLTGFQYDGEKCNEAAKQLSDTIRMKLKALAVKDYPRYKFIVQVLIGERREQGMHFGTRCFWDSNTDNQASENFTNVRCIYHGLFRLFLEFQTDSSYHYLIFLHVPLFPFKTGPHFLCGYCLCYLLILIKFIHIFFDILLLFGVEVNNCNCNCNNK